MPANLRGFLYRRGRGHTTAHAIKYSPEYSTILVSTASDDNAIRITVEDQGPGIPDAELRLIFDKHFRGEFARKMRIPGTGVGLTIAKYVVEEHRGRIDVDSKPGAGTAFSIIVPR